MMVHTCNPNSLDFPEVGECQVLVQQSQFRNLVTASETNEQAEQLIATN